MRDKTYHRCYLDWEMYNKWKGIIRKNALTAHDDNEEEDQMDNDVDNGIKQKRDKPSS